MPRPRLPFRTLAASVALVVAACGGPSDDELLSSAKDYLAKKQTQSAIIQLKTLLQHDPQRAEARFLLGRSLLDGGDVAGAGVELRKAYELKFDANQVAPALARALLLQGEDRKVVDTFGALALTEARANADLKTTLGLALARLGKADESDQAIQQALTSVPGFAPAKVFQARQAAGKQDFATALARLDEVTTADPANAEAWLLKGELQQRGLHDDAAALVSYRKAAALRDDLMAAHQGIVSLLVKAGDAAGADAHVQALKKSHPNEPVTKLLEAQMAYLRKDYAAARDLAEPLLQAAPNNALVLQLAGAAAYQLHALPKAENLLAQALTVAPGLPLARQLLAQTYLRTGQPEKALDTLRPAIEANPPLPGALTLAGEAYLQSGDTARAEAMFARAAKLQPGDARARTALALGQIDKGNAAGGMAELQTLATVDPGITANLALIAAHLRRKELDQALQAIDALERKQPDRPLAANLRGRVLMLRKDAAGARTSFERALKLDPAYFPAVVSLAALDLAEKKPDAARQRFDALIKTDPKNYRARLALASLLARTGGSAAAVAEQLTAAVQASPSEAAPRLQLIGHHLNHGDPKAALAAAQDAVAALPASRELLNALGRAQLANGDFEQAVTAFNKLAALQPKSPLAPLGLAEAYQGLKNYDAAETSLKHALELAPDLLSAQRALIGLMVGDGRYTEALAVARDVQKQRPAEAVGYQLEGDIELQRRHWDPALAAYRTGLQKARSADAAIKVHHALVTAGRNDEADRFAAGWQKDQPQDAAFRFYLGDAALARKDWALAEARYREVLKLQPDNPMALNNVAWLLVKQSKPGALPFAEQATKLVPDQLPLLDTLALALAADGQAPRALELQKKTVERAPDDPALRLTLARLYLKTGDKAQARAELEKLAKLGRKFADQDDVAELLKGT